MRARQLQHLVWKTFYVQPASPWVKLASRFHLLSYCYYFPPSISLFLLTALQPFAGCFTTANASWKLYSFIGSSVFSVCLQRPGGYNKWWLH
jgi:hypothetical protein